LYRVLDLLESSAFRDVARSFRVSALVPECHARVLLWLLASPRHRSYLTPRLIARLLVRLAVRVPWWVLKPYAPAWVRPAARRLARRWAQCSAFGEGGKR
jgi:hypothetical protein